MYYEEALGIGRQLTRLQREMLFDLESWTEVNATPYNRDELLWKQLIAHAPDGQGFVRTERGEEVYTVAMLKALSDKELLWQWKHCDGECPYSYHVIREIEDRQLDL